MALFEKREWKDRIAEFAGRRKLTDIVTGEEKIVDVARHEGLITQTGDAFNKVNMDDLETRIKTAIGEGDLPEELGNDIISAITQLYSDNVNNNVFSFEETRIGTWVDGKPLYRKMIYFGALPNNAVKSVPVNVENIDIAYVNIGHSYYTNGTTVYDSFIMAGAILMVRINKSTNTAEIQTGVNLASFFAIVCAEYTKTTD